MDLAILKKMGFYEVDDNQYQLDIESKGLSIIIGLENGHFEYCEIYQNGELIKEILI